MISRRDVLLAGSCAVATLAGCARIPGSGPVHQVDIPLTAGGRAPYLQAQPPANQASPVQVVQSFLHASLALADDASIAREHLGGALTSAWDPRARVVVYSGTQDLVIADEGAGKVRLEALAIERIDQNGVRQPLAKPEEHIAHFTLERIDGRWRIVQAPPGVFMSDAVFPLLYSPARLYFLDPTRTILVPDIRWFPAQGQASSVLAGLANGPSPALGDSVVSAVPPSASVSRAVTTENSDGALRLLLPTVIERLDGQAFTQAVEQIRASLGSISGLQTVAVAVGSDDIPRSATPAVAVPGHRIYAAAPVGVVPLDDGVQAEDIDLSNHLVADFAGEQLRAPSLHARSAVAAGLLRRSGDLIIGTSDSSSPVRVLPTAGTVASPQVDHHGWVWAVPHGTTGRMRVFGLADSADIELSVPWLEGRQILSMDLAPDGTRMVVLSADVLGTRVDLTAVIRDGDGTPRGITTQLRIPTGHRDDRQVRWFSETRLLALGVDEQTSTLQISALDLQGGEPQSTVVPADAVAIAGTDLTEQIWIATESGAIFRGADGAWNEVLARVRDPGVF